MKKFGWILAGLVAAVSLILFLNSRACLFNCALLAEPENIDANYELKLVLDKEDNVRVDASITVTNSSDQSLKDIGFFLVPNAMNSKETPFYEYDDAALKLASVSVNGKKAEYQLDNNGLLVELDQNLETQSTVVVDINYRMRLPEYGMRLSQIENNFYLALLDPDDWETQTITANDTELRVFAPMGAGILETTAEMAADAYIYFEEEIGDNPNGELDIIANDGYMEYPNIIEVASEQEALESVLIHEIAHQWFYYLVTNDPFRESWLDESLTEFSSALYISEQNGDADSGFDDAAFAEAAYPTEKYANIPLDDFEEPTYYSTIYGKVPMLFKEFFDANGGTEAAFGFLSAYYQEFQFKQVDSEAFKQFFEAYFEGDQSEFLDSWLK